MASGHNYWFILFRNSGTDTNPGREIENIVVAWLDMESLQDEIDRYVAWDRKASEATRWEIVRVRRSARVNGYFKPKKKPENPDCLEYHWVLEDFRQSNQAKQAKVIRTIS